jgi:uncharacterized protein YgiM (DUF1202 family)
MKVEGRSLTTLSGPLPLGVDSGRHFGGVASSFRQLLHGTVVVLRRIVHIELRGSSMQRIERALLTLTACGGLLALLVAGETAGPGRQALADTVKARRASHVYSSPGDQSRVVARVRPGDKIQVLQRKNRWFRVRVKGRTGWITRKSVAKHAASRGRGRRRPVARRGGRDRIAVRSTSDVARELQARDPSVRDELKQRAIVRQRILRRELELARAEELALVQAEQREAARRAGGRLPQRRFDEADSELPGTRRTGGRLPQRRFDEADSELPGAERTGGRLPQRRFDEADSELPGTVARSTARGATGRTGRPAPRRVGSKVEAEAEALAIDGVAGDAARPVAVRTRARGPLASGTGADGAASADRAAADFLDADEEIDDGVIIRESDRIDRSGRTRGSAAVVRESDPLARESDPLARESDPLAREADPLAREAGPSARDQLTRDDQENPLAPRPVPAGPRDGADTAGRETVVVKVARARLYELPSARSEPVERAAVGSELAVLGRSGRWMKVQNQRGVAGWIPDASVQRPRRAPPVPRLARRASAGVGYTSIGQSFASSSDDPRGVYSLSSGAAVLGLDGELVHATTDRWRLAGDLAYRLAIAVPGIRYVDPESMAGVDIGFKRHQVDLGARAGYTLGGDMGMVAYGRLGFRYDNFRINDVSNFDRNLARLPSEVLTGVTVGALLDVPRLGRSWSARARVDALPLLASRQQTAGLEDGASSRTFAAWGGALVEYAWDDVYRLSAAYEYAYARTRWNGAQEGSMRPHMADSARRKDSAHQLFLGVVRSF